MPPPNMLRKSQVLGEYYQNLFQTLVPGWPGCLDKENAGEPKVQPEAEATFLAQYTFPPGIFEPSAIGALSGLDHNIREIAAGDHGVAVDAWVTSNGKVYICDLVNLHRVAVSTPSGKTGPLDELFLKRKGKIAEFVRAGAVMAVDNETMIVVKDMKGLHFFDAKTDEFLYSSSTAPIISPYGLAMLKDGSLATFSERQKSVVVVGIDGNIRRVVRLADEIIHDIRTMDVQMVRFNGVCTYGARIRFMCANVRKDGVEAIYMVDESVQRIYAVSALDGELIWKKDMREADNGMEVDGLPKGIVALPNGKLIVALYKCNSLVVLDENGSFEQTLPTEAFGIKPQGMYVQQVGGKAVLLVVFGTKVNTSTNPCVYQYELPEMLVN